MASTIVLPTRSSIRTQRISPNNITKSNLDERTVQLFEYYVPTITPSQMISYQLITQYYLSTRRGKHSYETNALFYDQSYNDRSEWFKKKEL